jgi:hypothetical protein
MRRGSIARGRHACVAYVTYLVACAAWLAVAGAAMAKAAPTVVPGAPNLALPPPAESVPAAPPPEAPPAEPPHGGGDAEPAPLSPASEAPRPSTGAPPVSDTLAPSGRHRVAFGARFAYRLGDAGQAISPAAGYGIVGSYGFTYARVADAVELSASLDFASDRFATAEQGTTTDGPGSGATTVTYSSTRVLSENDFVLGQTVAFPLGPVRPFLMLGVGVGVGSFETVDPQLRPANRTSGSETDTHLLGRGTLGLDIAVSPSWAVCVRGDYTAVRRAAPFPTPSGQALPLFGDLLDIDVQAVFRF